MDLSPIQAAGLGLYQSAVLINAHHFAVLLSLSIFPHVAFRIRQSSLAFIYYYYYYHYYYYYFL